MQIYAFYFFDAEAKRYFYVGRSKDVDRRMREHRYHKKTGHEDKYERIRQLEAAGKAWASEVIDRVAATEYFPDAERWHVIRLTREGHDLMNMRHGSIEHRKELVEQIRSRQIRNVADVRADRQRRESVRKFRKSKRLQRRIWAKELKENGIPSVAKDKLLPPIYRCKLLAHLAVEGRHDVQFAPGWQVGEFIHWVRRPLSKVREFQQFVDSLPPIRSQ